MSYAIGLIAAIQNHSFLTRVDVDHSAARKYMKLFVEDVFVTEGVPKYTFITPPNFNDIFLDIRRPGKPVIIEGQSGTGKTTCVKKIIEKLDDNRDVYYWTARKNEDIEHIYELIGKPRAGTFVIDDFHRLSHELQEKLANIAKTAAEQADSSNNLPKLVLIGINEVGSQLIQLVPDIAKRTGIHKILPGTEVEIGLLISQGSAQLGIEIVGASIIFTESRGDYWLTQQLCQTVCTMNDILQSDNSGKSISFNLSTLRLKVVERLKSAYYPAVKDFSRGRRFRSSNDPYFKLLRAIASQDSSIVDLSALANSNPEVRGSINNIKDHRLGVLLNSKPSCARYFYYNTETKGFALEDPALFYFLQHLDWDKLRTDCGFKNDAKDFDYDFAISFAGENRELARHLANQLEIFDASVFFDENFESNFLGKTWSTEFKRIFSDASRLVVCLLDEYHCKKIWPTFERECFTPRVAEGDVIPIYLDKTKFVGIPQDIVGIVFKSNTNSEGWKTEADDVVLKLLERIA